MKRLGCLFRKDVFAKLVCEEWTVPFRSNSLYVFKSNNLLENSYSKNGKHQINMKILNYDTIN